jgi:hypothetical protein
LQIVLVCFFLLIAFGFQTSVAEQQEKRHLKNSDVVGMVKAGLSEATIVLVIEHGSCEFDTSPAALIELKNQGVSPAVMEAMMRAQDSAPVAPRQQSISAPPPTGPASADPNKAAGVELLAEGVY